MVRRYWATILVPSHTLWHVCVLLAVYTWFSYMMLYQQLLGQHQCAPYLLP